MAVAQTAISLEHGADALGGQIFQDCGEVNFRFSLKAACPLQAA